MCNCLETTATKAAIGIVVDAMARCDDAGGRSTLHSVCLGLFLDLDTDYALGAYPIVG